MVSGSRLNRAGYMRAVLALCSMILLAACGAGAEEPRAVLPTLAQLASPLPAEAIAILPSVTPAPADTVAPSATPAIPVTASPTSAAVQAESPTPSVTPSATITDTPSPTPTDFPTEPPENRPLTSLLMDALSVTLLPSDFQIPAYQGLELPVVTPTPQPDTGVIVIPPAGGAVAPSTGAATACTYLPAGGFGTVFTTNPDIARDIGCPLGSPPDVLSINAAYQPFQQGFMVWLNGEILVFYGTSRSFQRYTDTWTEGVDPQTSGEVAPAGLFAPVRGFNKVWANNPAVRNGLGWAIQAEQGAQATAQNFNSGRMLWLPLRNDILTLISADGQAGSWVSVTGRF